MLMVSKIALELPDSVCWQPEVANRLMFGGSGTWSQSDNYYRDRFDLRKIGIPAMLHVDSRTTGRHKAELHHADESSYRVMLRILGALFRDDPTPFKVMRIDFSADVPDFSIDWFRVHTKVAHKRRHDVYSSTKRSGETQAVGMYFGAGNDQIRVYDKLEELRFSGRTSEFPFATWAHQRPSYVTRFERQLRTTKLPPMLRTFGDLKDADAFNPFVGVSFVERGRIAFYRGSVRRTLEAAGFEALSKEMGFEALRRTINRHSRGNFSRIMRRIPSRPPLQFPNLAEIYGAEARAQMGKTRHLGGADEE